MAAECFCERDEDGRCNACAAPTRDRIRAAFRPIIDVFRSNKDLERRIQEALGAPITGLCEACARRQIDGDLAHVFRLLIEEMRQEFGHDPKLLKASLSYMSGALLGVISAMSMPTPLCQKILGDIAPAPVGAKAATPAALSGAPAFSVAAKPAAVAASVGDAVEFTTHAGQPRAVITLSDVSGARTRLLVLSADAAWQLAKAAAKAAEGFAEHG